MTRRTSDSRSRHKSTKESSSLGKRGTRGRHHHEQQHQQYGLQPDPSEQWNATNSNGHHNPKSSSLPQHPANCECWKLHPGLFLPESLLQPTNNPPGNNKNDNYVGLYQQYPSSWVDNEDADYNEKA